MNMRGFTLTELLVAMLLLSTATAGGMAAFAQARLSWQDAGVEARMHERAQYVFATLEPELQMAGYFGASGRPSALVPSTIPSPAMHCGIDLVRRLDVALEVHPTFDLPCAAQGGGPITGSQALVVRRASGHVAQAEAGRAQWWSDAIRDISGVLAWNGAAPAGAAASPEVRDLLVRAFYIARQADGDPATPALRVKSLSSVAGTPTFIDTEVMPGVEALQVELLPSPASPVQARITIQVRADQADLRARDTARRLSFTRLFTVRNAAPG